MHSSRDLRTTPSVDPRTAHHDRYIPAHTIGERLTHKCATHTNNEAQQDQRRDTRKLDQRFQARGPTAANTSVLLHLHLHLSVTRAVLVELKRLFRSTHRLIHWSPNGRIASTQAKSFVKMGTRLGDPRRRVAPCLHRGPHGIVRSPQGDRTWPQYRLQPVRHRTPEPRASRGFAWFSHHHAARTRSSKTGSKPPYAC